MGGRCCFGGVRSLFYESAHHSDDGRGDVSFFIPPMGRRTANTPLTTETSMPRSIKVCLSTYRDGRRDHHASQFK